LVKGYEGKKNMWQYYCQKLKSAWKVGRWSDVGIQRRKQLLLVEQIWKYLMTLILKNGHNLNILCPPH
jgi:hypothetical protein